MNPRILLVIALALMTAACVPYSGSRGYYRTEYYSADRYVTPGYYRQDSYYIVPQRRYYSPAPRYYPPAPRYYQPAPRHYYPVPAPHYRPGPPPGVNRWHGNPRNDYGNRQRYDYDHRDRHDYRNDRRVGEGRWHSRDRDGERRGERRWR